jgi:hypothetical protein
VVRNVREEKPVRRLIILRAEIHDGAIATLVRGRVDWPLIGIIGVLLVV